MIGKSVIARLAGVPLSAVGPVGWAFTPGGKPHTRLIEVSERAALALMDKRGSFVSLEIEAGEDRKLKIDKLLIVDIRAGSTPFTRRILVADRRYLWRRKVIVRDYNMRRRTGEVRLSQEGRLENKKLFPEIAYAPWSLDGGATYSPVAVMRDILTELEGAGAIDVPDLRRQVLIEDLFLNDPGDVAVDKVLSYLAGVGVWVDRFGVVRVYDTRDGGEAGQIANAGPPLQPHGHHGRALRAYARPRRVNVLLERECEVRFDFTESDTSIATVVRSTREPRSLEMVIPSPDLSLLYNGNTVGRGTILEFNAWLAAISGTEARTAGSEFGALSQAILRQHYLQWHYIAGKYGTSRTSAGFPDLEWKKRLGAVRNCWRKMFRVLPRWRDKMRSMKAVRVGMSDPTTGTRAPTEPYMDFISKPSGRAQNATLANNPDIGHQVAGWATLLKDGQTAPANVIVDEEAGTLLIQFTVDPWGDAEEIAPGNVAALPTHKVEGDLNANGTAYLIWGRSPLLATFRVAVVLSCIQASPNNAGRYHKVVVEPATGSTVLGVPLGDCLGVEMTIYIPAGTATARFMWDDAQAAQIENAFFDGAAMPETLMQNPEQVKAVAEAAAAREWAQFLDRDEGAFAVALNADVEIAGAIAIVEHTVPPNGPPVTSLAVYPEMQALDPMSLVPASVQRTMRHLVQP